MNESYPGEFAMFASRGREIVEAELRFVVMALTLTEIRELPETGGRIEDE